MECESFVLSYLSLRGHQTEASISEILKHAGYDDALALLQSLQEQGRVAKIGSFWVVIPRYP